MCIQDTFAPLLQKCSKLSAAGEDTDKRTSDILDEAHDFVLQVKPTPSTQLYAIYNMQFLANPTSVP